MGLTTSAINPATVVIAVTVTGTVTEDIVAVIISGIVVSGSPGFLASRLGGKRLPSFEIQ